MTVLDIINSMKDAEKSYAWFVWYQGSISKQDRDWIDTIVQIAYLEGEKKGMKDAQTFAKRILVDGEDVHEVLKEMRIPYED